VITKPKDPKKGKKEKDRLSSIKGKDEKFNLMKEFDLNEE
jgi:hypothetical protein